VSAARRRENAETVTPLELFFDLVFVLAITQCTALMSDDPTWQGLARGLLVLGVLWWSWVAYAWLTSVVDPEDPTVRLTIFTAMGALLVVALCVPDAFDDSALLFACAYGVVRGAQIVLFVIASGDDEKLRHSVLGLAFSTAVGVGLLVAASFADGTLQGAIWVLALALDMGGPLLIDSSGWQLNPQHFAERHGLIIIIAIGESIVAIGVGAEGISVNTGEVVAAVLGVALAAGLWGLYFDVVARVAARRLTKTPKGKEQNEVARDSFSYLHLPMVAGIVLVALGLKKTLEHVDDPLKIEPAVALLGGVILYLLGHVAFRWRNVHRLSTQRIAVAVLMAALTPLAVELPAVATLAIVAATLVVLLTYEWFRFRELRERLIRQELGDDPLPAPESVPAAG